MKKVALVFALLLAAEAISGCTSKPTNLQHSCVQEGNSDWWRCEDYPWYKYQCGRWN